MQNKPSALSRKKVKLLLSLYGHFDNRIEIEENKLSHFEATYQ